MAVSGLTGIVAISAGTYLSVALKSDGTVWGWGNNQYGQLGDGTQTERTTPVQSSGLSGIVRVDAGGLGHVMALKNDGTVWLWDTICGVSSAPACRRTAFLRCRLRLGPERSASTRALDAPLAVKSDGTVRASGWNTNGQIGDGSTTNRSTPVAVSGLSGVVAVAGNYSHSVALKNDGTARAWGSNGAGTLGDGTTTDRSTRLP